MPNVRGEPGYGRHAAPDRQRRRNQVTAVRFIRVTRNGHAQRHIEQRKSGTGQKPEPGIANLKLVANGR